MKPIHDFHKDLAASQALADEPWWEQMYRKAFPSLLLMSPVLPDGWAQRAGIDRVLTLDSGKILCIDEKVRYQDYGDILLEVWSNEEKGMLGWMEKELATDYIAYVVKPSRKCYMLPYRLLRDTWQRYRNEWWQSCEIKRAKNKNYTTVSVAVPVETLQKGMLNTLLVNWGEP